MRLIMFAKGEAKSTQTMVQLSIVLFH